METELKLAVPAGEIGGIEKLELLQRYGTGQGEEKRLVSTYYDTPALDLRAERVSLRLRNKGGRWIRTVKTAGSSAGGLHRRNEFEVELEREALDLEAIKMLGIEVITRVIDTQQLEPQFVTDFVRKQWLLQAPQGGAVVELALDRGWVRRCGVEADEEGVEICEVELELRDDSDRADPAFLFQLADEIRAAGITAEPDAVSKASRGYALIAET